MATRGHVGELEVLRHGEVARDPDSSLDGDDVEEAKHRRAAVLNLHDLVPAHVAGLDEAKGIINAQRREHADVALREHLRRARAWRRSALNCESSDVEVKWRHHVDLARGGDEPLKGRHRAGNCALAKKSHNADLCEAAVVK